MWFGAASSSRRNLEKSVILPVVEVGDAEGLVMTMEMSKRAELGEIGENGKENEEMRTFWIFFFKNNILLPKRFPPFLYNHPNKSKQKWLHSLLSKPLGFFNFPPYPALSHVLLSESLFSHVPLCSPEPES